MNDLEFSFNPAPFTNAIQKIAQALNFVEDKFKSAAGKMNLFTKKTEDDSKKSTDTIKDNSVNFGKQMGDALTRLIAKVGALGAAYMGIKALMARMPEVGQTFSIAGDILMKNFVWPLRQELLPYLQKILNWARDNRTTMLQWGQVLVNIFRAIVQVAKTIIDALKPIFDVFKNIIKRMFGDTIKSISDVLNILVFKMTVIALFIVEIFKPIIAAIAKIIGKIYEIGAALSSGIANSFDNTFGTWGEVIGDLIKSFQELFKAISEVGDGEMWNNILSIFKFAGQIIGGTLKIALKVVTDIIKILTALFAWDIKKAPKWLQTIITSIRELPQAIANISKQIQGFFSGIADSITAFFDDLEKTIIDSIKSFVEKIKKAADYVTDFIPGMKGSKTIIKQLEEKTKESGKEIPGKGIMDIIKPMVDLKGIKTGSNTEIKNNINFGDIKISANTEAEGRAGAKGFMDEINKSIFNGLRFDMSNYQATRG